jgi:exosortase
MRLMEVRSKPLPRPSCACLDLPESLPDRLLRASGSLHLLVVARSLRQPPNSLKRFIRFRLYSPDDSVRSAGPNRVTTLILGPVLIGINRTNYRVAVGIHLRNIGSADSTERVVPISNRVPLQASLCATEADESLGNDGLKTRPFGPPFMDLTPISPTACVRRQRPSTGSWSTIDSLTAIHSRMIHQKLQRTTLPRSERAEAGKPAVPHLLFLCACVISLIVFRTPLETLFRLAFHDDRYTSTLAIPFISFALVWSRREIIFVDARSSLGAGLAFVLAGLALFVFTALPPHPHSEYILPVSIFALLLTWTGAFVCCYGTQAARGCLFPLVFLLLTIPIPVGVLDHIVVALQRGSAEVTYRLFKVVGVPVFREGMFKFSLPGITIEVADECSGIRSALSTFIGSMAAGYVILRSSWSRASFALLTIPIVIFKNAVRIVTLSWLGVYIDSGFLHGRLHRYGGLPFSLLALALLAPVLLVLVKTERRDETNA